MANVVSFFITLILLSVVHLNVNETAVTENLSRTFGSWAKITNIKTVQLLNQLCNQSQVKDSKERDACYGCFFRASSLVSGYTMLLSMATCADNYLKNTEYGHCQAYLKNATSNVNPKVSATTIYCTFLECIRQVNKDALIRECIEEARQMFPGFNFTSIQLAQLFVNTSACILSKTRCAVFNPITGAIQDTDITNKFHLPSMNALFVNSDYDINIVQMSPFSWNLGDECAKRRNIRQASWPSANC